MPTPSTTRRTVLKTSAAIAAAGPFAGLVAAPASARRAPSAVDLLPIPDARDGKVRLHLPQGFSYRSFHDTEATVVLNDTTVLPGRHDGMGAFKGPDGTVILVRNHEVNSPVAAAFGPGTPYDSRAGGGTTTIHCTPDGQVLNAFTSLNGTMMNCSGGVMPWGSWITCEETVNGPDVGPDFTGTSKTKPWGCSRNSFVCPVKSGVVSGPLTVSSHEIHEPHGMGPPEQFIIVPLRLVQASITSPCGVTRTEVVPPRPWAS